MTDDKECKSCAILRRYEKTARERGYAMGKAAGNNELAQAQELLAFERKAHAETNAALTAEITRLEAQLAAAAPGAVPDKDGNYLLSDVQKWWEGYHAGLAAAAPVTMSDDEIIEAADASSKGSNTAPGLPVEEMKWLFGMQELRAFLALAAPLAAAAPGAGDAKECPVCKTSSGDHSEDCLMR